jgi:hypothetical protein
MNGVSTLLYLADVSSNVQSLLVFSGGIGLFVGGFLGAVLCIENNVPLSKTYGWMAPLFFTFSLIACAIPSKTTMLAIATSEFAEDFSKTEAGTEIGGLVQDTIKLLRKSVDDLNEGEYNGYQAY